MKTYVPLFALALGAMALPAYAEPDICGSYREAMNKNAAAYKSRMAQGDTQGAASARTSMNRISGKMAALGCN